MADITNKQKSYDVAIHIFSVEYKCAFIMIKTNMWR